MPESNVGSIFVILYGKCAVYKVFSWNINKSFLCSSFRLLHFFLFHFMNSSALTVQYILYACNLIKKHKKSHKWGHKSTE